MRLPPPLPDHVGPCEFGEPVLRGSPARVLTRRSLTAAVGMLVSIRDLAAAPSPAGTPFPTGASFRQIGTYGLDRLAQITGPELTDFMAASPMSTTFAGRFAPPRYPVSIYQLTYRSVVPDGRRQLRRAVAHPN